MNHPILKWAAVDMVRIFSQKRIWAFLIISALICANVFLIYWEEFLAIQYKIQDKGIKYGIGAILLFPYLKTLGLTISIAMAFWGARIGYWDVKSHYSKLFLCHVMQNKKNPLYWLMAKALVISLLAFVLVFLVAMPVLLSGVYYTYDVNWLLFVLLGLWGLNVVIGLLALTLSLKITSSITVVFFTCFLGGGSEISNKLIVEPLWLSDIFSFYSPIHHVVNLSIGIFSSSSLLFFFSWVGVLLLICYHFFISNLSKL